MALGAPPVLLSLAPLLVGRARRGVVGSSRYAKTLRESVRQAAADVQQRTVFILGEPGLEKDNIAALIHFGSPQRKELMLRLDAALTKADGSDLLAPLDASDGRSLIELVGDGSLLIDQVDRAPETLKHLLLELLDGHHGFRGRLFFTSETVCPDIERCCSLIRVPPLRVRRQDLGEWLRYGIRLRSQKLGWPKAPEVSEAVIKRLQAYDFPSNIRELETLIDRALQQINQQDDSTFPELIPEDVFWTPPRQQRYRFDIWRWKPQLREWMRAPLLWNTLLFGVVSWLFVLVNLWLWLGPQDRAHNGALNLFWARWWPLILLG